MVVQKVFWYLKAASSTVPDVIFLFKLENKNFPETCSKQLKSIFIFFQKFTTKLLLWTPIEQYSSVTENIEKKAIDKTGLKKSIVNFKEVIYLLQIWKP